MGQLVSPVASSVLPPVPLINGANGANAVNGGGSIAGPSSAQLPPSSLPPLSSSSAGPPPIGPNGPPSALGLRPPGMPPIPESLVRLAKANEETWMAVGGLAERMGDLEGSLNAYENAIRHNPKSIDALLRVASIARSREDLGKVHFYLFTACSNFYSLFRFFDFGRP